MNFFEYFNLEEAYLIDSADLRRAYLQKSREVHPDLASGQGDGDAIESTALANLAYETLKDPIKRIQYILELNAIPTDAKSAPLSNDFLMDMMDVNELIEVAQTDPIANEKAIAELSNFENSLNGDYEDVLSEYSAKALNKEASLLNLRDYLHKKNYLNRLKSLLEGISEL
jgi:molecular chaperone HscB